MDAKKIISGFQLVKAAVISLEVKNSFLEYDEHLNGSKTIDVAYQITDSRTIEEKKIHGGSLDLHVTVASKINDSAYIIHMIYRGLFTAPSEMTFQEFSRMLKINGTASLYSMARAVLISISSQMFSGGSILLPMVNVIQFHELTESAVNNKESND